MSTKTTTDSTNQYNSSSMGTYNSFQPQIGSTLMQMVQNPLGNSYFQNQLAQQQSAGNQIAARNNTNLLRNMRTGGGILSNSGGFMAGSLNRNNIAASGMQANAFNSALNSALANRSTALMAMQAYQPLQTGQTSTQTQSGLGTWLPQVAGAALNMAMPGIGSMLGGGSFGAGYKPAASPSFSPPSTSGSMNPYSSGPWAQPWGGYSSGGRA